MLVPGNLYKRLGVHKLWYSSIAKSVRVTGCEHPVFIPCAYIYVREKPEIIIYAMTFLVTMVFE